MVLVKGPSPMTQRGEPDCIEEGGLSNTLTPGLNLNPVPEISGKSSINPSCAMTKPLIKELHHHIANLLNHHLLIIILTCCMQYCLFYPLGTVGYIYIWVH